MKTKGPDTPEAWSAASKGYAANIAPLMMEAMTFISEPHDGHTSGSTS